jgi:hypothetical protein
MTWDNYLINVYFLVCTYEDELSAYTLRQSNNAQPSFTDAEVMTIYLYCSVNKLGLTTKKEIYTYADYHLRSWFPQLPKYEAFVLRCNFLESAMQHLGACLYEQLCVQMPENEAPIREFLTDSLPIMLAQRQRAKQAKVAREIADLGWCATKKLAYHGVKLHALGLMSAARKLPTIYASSVTAASVHDGKAFKQDLAERASNSKVYADSAYCDEAATPELKELFNVTVCPIQKRVRGQEKLGFFQICQNTAISTIRQPIEGLFNWLIQHTGIQDASKCRSTKGLLFHIHAKIAASAVLLLIFNA